MSVKKETKINSLLKTWPEGTLALSAWLRHNGISGQLLNRYKKSGWLESVGTGALKRSGDNIDYHGAIYALQEQRDASIHAGGPTSLSLQGKGHYIDMVGERVVLFGKEREPLPSWFKKQDWSKRMDYHTTSFLPAKMGLVDWKIKNFSVKISGPVRAILECLYLIPKHQELLECYQLMQGMNNLRPDRVQELLENCSSIKVKRLFLYFAEKLQHPWYNFLDLSKIDLGSGNRSFTKSGITIKKYKITVPRELAE